MNASLPLPLPGLETIVADARRRAPEIEAARCLPDDLAGAMARAGVFRMLVPRAQHGLEVHPDTFIDVLAALAHADGATGWCAMIGATTGSLASALPEAAAERIYGSDPDLITCGVTAPMGRAVAVDGGFRVTGRWPFGSASRNAHWICGGCTVVDGDGETIERAPGVADVRLLMFAAADVVKHDNWHVSGLRGTGSGDIEVTDLFVPEDHGVILGSRPRVDAPLFRFPTFGLLALGVASVALGIGRRALDELVDLAGGKVPTGGRKPLAARATVQVDAARADAGLRGARALMRETVDQAWQAAVAGERLTTQHKADLRLAAVNATWAAVDAVDRCYHAAGGSAIYADSQLQRCFRDVHVATQHVMVAQPVWELTGRVRLGMEVGGML
ncbi:MAG TPA: acyl-CoA dehydrogenase family protein [Pseudomonadales bacterium]|nr:acyl-CoA dehydrogenase family protein [Pseudomonadales bacterium]